MERDRYTIISADCHAGADLLGYKDHLETRWHDDFEEWAAGFENPFSDLKDPNRVRNWDNEVRQRDLEADGQVGEVVFPNTVPPFFPSSSLVTRPPATAAEFERRWAGLQAHNRWLAGWCEDLPGRRAGLVQIFPNDVAAAVAEVEWGAENGLKGVLFPAVPPDSGVAPMWSDVYDPLWAACQETGLSVNQHGGTGLPDIEACPARNFLMLMEVPFFANRTLWHMILGGAFERFPALKLVMTEQMVGWVPAVIAKMDAFWEMFRTGGHVGEMPAGAELLPHSPGTYFRRNCYLGSSFPSPDEAEAMRTIGIERVMWGSDYPHREGTFPDSVASLRHVFHDWDVDDLELVLGRTAAEVYGLDFEQLSGIGIGPTVDEVAEPITELPDNPSMAFGRRF